MSTILVIFFWLCAGLILYTYAVYPLLVMVLSEFLGKDRTAREVDSTNWPNVSLLIAAYNEQAVIERRIANALAMDYPKEKLEIAIASDGSNDETANIVKRYAGQGVRLIEFAERRGKSAVLNRAIPQLRGEIVVLSDANSEFEPSALKKLVRWFDDPAVGIVSGRLVLTDARNSRNADSLYWNYETFLKKSESRLGGLLGANGAIYAIRRSCFTPIPDDTVVDDFLIPLLMRLHHGFLVHYDFQAIAYEQAPNQVRDEFRRRMRIGTGNLQNLSLLWPLLDPRQGFVAISFFSHKVLRWLCPFLLIGILIGSACLFNHPFFRVVTILQGAFYCMAMIVAILPRSAGVPKLFRLPTMFVSMNLALLVGYSRWLLQNHHGTWEPTARRTEQSEPAHSTVIAEGKP
ncbi:MAG TPA: glycosyltransferase family 2 protein [Tepidisphaeraceae bacterium]|nr:glycosyltransferase family 2 protein [Tepidisphaeraceae bacterium]